MKIGISFLGCMVSLLVSEMKGEDGTCSVSQPGYYDCHKDSGVGTLFVIPKSVPETAKSIILHSDDGRKSWLINSINYFSRYPALVEISIFGPVKVDDSLLGASTKIDLQNKLFDLPKLNVIHCRNCLFNSNNHMWKLPWEIQRLSLENNMYDSFKVSYSPHLIELNLEHNNLKKMPDWYEDKPPPVETLRLYNNPLLKITFYDIAKLCDLNVITLNAVAEACDCFRISKWMKEFEMNISSPNGHTLRCHKISNCDENKTEEYQVKDKFCRNKRQRKENGKNIPFKQSDNSLKAIFVIVFILFSICASGLVMYTRYMSRRKRRKGKRGARTSFPEIGAYF